MNLMRKITGLLLVLFVAASGIPCYLAEDASRDGTVDLQDAILQVKDFADSADDGAPFLFSFEKMLSTVSSVAGLKRLVDPDREGKSSNHPITQADSPDRIINTYAIQLPPLLLTSAEFPENRVTYQSRSLDPSTPPPRQA